MSYDNAEPKILKTLNSEGQVLDDSGNVIGETSDYWVQLYNQTEPKVDKILHSDGTIKDSAGNLIQDATEFNIKKYNQAEPIPAKYLHADGTIDENSGSGSGANLEDNKEVEITENGEIEITPSSGYDGMKKVTAIINVSGASMSQNIPSWLDTTDESTINNSIPPANTLICCKVSDYSVVYLEGDGVKDFGTLIDGEITWFEFIASCGNDLACFVMYSPN